MLGAGSGASHRALHLDGDVQGCQCGAGRCAASVVGDDHADVFAVRMKDKHRPASCLPLETGAVSTRGCWPLVACNVA
jgi:hypothetical protein